MRIKKPGKQQKPKMAPVAKHPMALPGMRWMSSIALSPANLLQLQQSAGNQAVVELLRKYADPVNGSLSSLKTYRAARKDGYVPLPGVDSEELMKSQDPHYGDWHFHFVANNHDGGTAMYWITLNRYKSRQRHILIDSATNTPLEVTGADLDERDRKLLMDWAAQLLVEQLSGHTPQLAPPTTDHKPNPDEEEEDDLLSALLDDGGDEGNGLGAAAIAAAVATAGNKGSQGQRQWSHARRQVKWSGTNTIKTPFVL